MNSKVLNVILGVAVVGLAIAVLRDPLAPSAPPESRPDAAPTQIRRVAGHLRSETRRNDNLERRLAALERAARERADEQPGREQDDDRLSGAEPPAEPSMAHSGDVADITVALDQAFAERQPNPGVSQQRRTELEQLMTGHPELFDGTSVVDFACSTTSCRAEVSHDDPTAAEKFRATLHRSFAWAAVAHVSDDGASSTVYATTDPQVVSGILAP